MATKTGEVPAIRRRPGGARGVIDIVYTYLAALFVLGVLVQVYLAGLGIFGINASKVANASSFDAHRDWGAVLMIIAIVLLILALAARQSRATMIGTFVLALLVTVAQSVLAAAGDSNKWVGGLHALDGMVILLLSVWLAVTAWRRTGLARPKLPAARPLHVRARPRKLSTARDGIMEGMGKRDLASGIGAYVAIGDSFTEGLHDPGPDGGYLGWADRVADALSAQRPGFRYANLAIRGKLLREVVAEQLPRAVELAPDLVSLAAGGNDILHGYDVDALAAEFEPAVAKLQAAGCRVIIFTGFDPRMFPVIRLLRGRIAAYNMHLRGIVDEYGCDLVDLWSMRVLKDPRAWSPDRLHLSTEGHRRVALRTCEVLGVPVAEDWRAALPPEPLPPAVRASGPANRAQWLAARRDDARWAREYAAPWVRRRFGGTSSGDGLPPKRPDLLPVS